MIKYLIWTLALWSGMLMAFSPWRIQTISDSGNNATYISNKTASTSFSPTYSASTNIVGGATSNNYVIALIASDNLGSGSDGNKGDVSAVSDNAGNTFSKLAEFSNVQSGAGTGATISIWAAHVDFSISSTTVTTMNFSGSVTAKVLLIRSINITGYSTGTRLRAANFTTSAVDGSNVGSMTLSGLPNKQYYFLRANALEQASSPGNYVADAGWTLMTPTFVQSGTSGGGAASNMSLYAEFIVSNATGVTSSPSLGVTADNAGILLALEEYVPIPHRIINVQ
jgi:hypothetical protein